MAGYLKQACFLAIFVALLGLVVFLRNNSTPQAATATSSADAIARYGFHLDEVAEAAGIHFVHSGPKHLDEKLQHILPIVAGMGASVTVVDYNRDGWPDLFVVNGGEETKCALYRNNRDGTFTDVAADVGLADLNHAGTGVCMGAVWGDYDNDGFEDVLVYKWGKPMLFHNEAGQRFVDVSAKANLPAWANTNAACWLDFDGDGKLDLFLADYWQSDLDLWHLPTSKVMPESFEYAKNGGRKWLLRNRGDGSFEDVTHASGIKSTRWTLAVAAAPLCGTRFPDLFLANDYGVSELYANRGGTFAEIGDACKIAEKPKSGMNASFGDINNNGKLAIHVSNITQPGLLMQHNNLWVPENRAQGMDPCYLNLADTLQVGNGGWSWGAQFGDLNNDGWQDLFQTNGYISADRKEDYWYDYSLIAGGNKVIIGDASKWPAIRGRSLSGYQQKCLWINRSGRFTDVAPAVGITDRHDGRSVALVDLWNRGALDLVVANQDGPLLIYKNSVTKDNHWVQFELEGTASNKSAIGAVVELHWAGHTQVQAVSGGNGYASQNMRRLHFGLGTESAIANVIIRWPSGKVQELPGPAIDTLHTLKEPT